MPLTRLVLVIPLVVLSLQPRGADAQPSLGAGDLAAGIGRDVAAGTVGKTSTVTSGSSGAAAKLAATYPAAQRAQVERMFADLLVAFGKIETALNAPAGDAAVALAALVIASYEVHRGSDVDQRHYQAVLAQLRGALAGSPGFARATPAKRREMYEELAILAMMVATSQKATGAALATVKAAAAGYLRGLGFDPDAMTIGAAGIASGTAAPAAKAPATPAPATPATSPAVAASKDIQAVSFYTVTSVGYNGFIQQLPTPIVLFKNGDALLELAQLNDPAGLAANKQQHAKAWTTWRKNGAKIERMTDKGWKALEWSSLYEPLPRGTTLEGNYTNTSFVGAIGKHTTAVAAWNKVQLDRAGRFTTQAGAGASNRGTATSTSSATSGGTYEIQGFTLTLRFDDGRVVHRGIVAKAGDKTIWIDGEGYSSK